MPSKTFVASYILVKTVTVSTCFTTDLLNLFEWYNVELDLFDTDLAFLTLFCS